MKKVIFLVLIILVLSACGKKTEEIKYSISISVDKTEIRGDNEEKIIISAAIKDQKGRIGEIDVSKISFFADDKTLFDNTFKNNTGGEYKLKAKYEESVSNEIVVTVKNYVQSITLEADTEEIIADNSDSAKMIVKAYDQNHKQVSEQIKIYSGDIEVYDKTFKTTVPGLYVLKAKVNEIISNEITIEAKEKSKMVKGTHVLITNESINTLYSEKIGTLNKRNNMGIVNLKSLNIIDKKMRVNPTIPYDNTGKNLATNQKRALNFKVGDVKTFWTYNFVLDKNVQINAVLQYSGKYCEIWANESSIINIQAAEKMGIEFDNKMYPIILGNFYHPSDVDGNQKVSILCYDIQEGFNGSGGYIAGYFYGGDLYDESESNNMEIFYIDTYPAMYEKKDVVKPELCYETIVHEFQHMVNFNKVYIVDQNKGYEAEPTWLNEGMSQAAEQIYSGKPLVDRIDYYNKDYDGLLKEGYSMLKWEGNLEDYSLSYMFLQYLKIHSGIGDKIFGEILTNGNYKYETVENLIKKYIDKDLTFGKITTLFRTALFKQEITGLSGFKGSEGFSNLTIHETLSSKGTLIGGGAVIVPISGRREIPLDRGVNIIYTGLEKIN